MNSDESQTHKKDQEQQPAVEAFNYPQHEQQAGAEASDDLDEQNPIDEWATQQDEAGAAADSLLDSLQPLGYENSEATPLDLTGLSPVILQNQSAKLELTQPLDTQRAVADLAQTVADLERQERELRQKIAVLQETQNKILADQLAKTQATVERMIQEGLSELEQRKQTLQISVEQLERRRERIRAEMRTTFAGVSQDLAIRVQGFK